MYASLDMGAQHSESTIDKTAPASNLKTTKLVSMPTWNDKDDSITSSTVPAIEYADQTEKEDDICPLCSKTAGINTIECGDCQLWLHFECGGVTKPADMTNKGFICRLCKDNLLYNTSNMSEHNTVLSDTQQSHDQPIFNQFFLFLSPSLTFYFIHCISIFFSPSNF
jgi:hypothetical protein